MGACESKKSEVAACHGHTDKTPINDKITPWWTFGDINRVVSATCTKVYDGDSIHLVANFYNPVTGMRTLQKIQCRVYGYDTNEIRGGTEETRKMAVEARNFLASFILDSDIFVIFGDNDKWGRPLVIISLTDNLVGDFTSNVTVTNPSSINSLMVSNGHGILYTGIGAKKQ